MPRGYRCIILAAFGWLIALQAQHDAVAEETASNQHAAHDAAAPSAMGKLPSAKEYEPDCKHSEDRQESELCAQWGAVAAARRGNDLAADANRAARDANAIGAQTLLWTKIGFGAVLSTLLATAWAAWAASRAAGIADKSMSLFRDAEGGILAPRIEITHGGAAYTVALPNRGRSPVSVIHADVSVMDEEPKGPIPTFVHQFPVDLMIAEGKAYEFGEYQFETNARYVYFVGGCIYKTFFWETRLCRIAARVDRETGAKEVLHTVNFSKWDRMIHAIRPVRWWQFWRRPS